MEQIRGKVLGELAGEEMVDKIYGEAQKELMHLLDRLVSEKKSGSVLVVGPRGAGKTTLVRQCIEDVREASFELASLNGILQTSDAAAVKELARQLCLTVETEDGENEIIVSDAVKDMLKSIRKPVVIVVDELDRFAVDRSAEKQSLLYSLFDATHNSTKPLLIIGISSRLDVMENLEKRVRSRVSQNQLLLLSDWTFDKYLKYAQVLMTVETTGKKNEDARTWNKSVQDTFSNEDVRKCLKRLYDTNRTMQKLRQYLTAVVSLSDLQNSRLSPDDFQKATSQLLAVDSRELILKSLSDLEISILLAAARCLKIHEAEELNFGLIYKEYERVMRNQKLAGASVTPKAIFLQIFDNLCNIGMFIPTKPLRSQANNLRQYQDVKLQMDPDAIRTYVKKGPYKSYMGEWLS